MMTNEGVTTLAYRTTPKTTKRTTFQDELQAAVTARASKTKTDQYSYSDDFEDGEDDFLNELLKSRKKKIDAFKAGKTKAKLDNFELSDDEDKQNRPKKVSFLKTQRKSSSPNATTPSEGQENEPAGSSVDEQANYNGSFPPQNSAHVREDNSHFENRGLESPDPEITRGYSSLSYLTSDDTLSLPLPSEGSVVNTPGPEEKKRNPVVGESSETPQRSSPHLNYTNSPDSVTEREPPRPKPRQRTLGLRFQATEKPAEENGSQDLSRSQTSSASVHHSTATSSNFTCTDGDATASCNLSKSSSNKSQQSQLLTKSTLDSGSRDGFISDDSKEPQRNYTSTFEEFNENTEDHSDQLSHAPEKSFDTRTSSSRSKSSERSQSVCSKKVESKYLGTLKVLDRKVSLQESQPQAADSLRAAIYQEWLKKKKEESKEKMQQKKKEELLKEKEKMKKEAKKEDAVASYEAWKEKKAESLKAKAKEQEDIIRKEQRATEEKQEKRQSAKQVFEKWKHEHDDLLKEKHRKQREAENKLKQQKQAREDERKRDSTSAFSDWCEKKKHVLHEKLTEERKELRTKVEEEQYMKEDRDKMSLEMYENWLTRKDLEQKRQQEERRIKEIIQDSPPPPWSPPNKTIPFRK
ncbi:microtubule-associated protein 9 [Melanotaenia boesemani]|uniref:microtubule-associated protein 9 n=1 Tax=Melanotaenia boesemani TaxID=1250792 RepID=UPI001C054B11|nr:microtubule-associated protein 9 [Melanotaenia boesemani]